MSDCVSEPKSHSTALALSLSSGTMWGVEFSGGRSHAPNHPADPLGGISRHHCLVGGLDEQPTLKLIP